MKSIIGIVYTLISLATAAGCDFPDPVHVTEYTWNDADPCRKYGIPGVGNALGHTQQTLIHTSDGMPSGGRLLIDIRTMGCGDYVMHDLQVRLLFRNVRASDAWTEPTPVYPMMEPPRIKEWTAPAAPLSEEQFATAFDWDQALKLVDSESISMLQPGPFTSYDWQDIKMRFAARPGLTDREIYLAASIFIWEDEATHIVFHKAH